jgi:octaprenyl-diphosphate synthase
MTTEDIFRQYAPELKAVEDRLLTIFSSTDQLIPEIGQYIINGGGKRIRPLFLLMASDLCDYKGNDQILYGAVIEAIHTASLLHDDVIDEAETRRRKKSANRIWGNQLVILVGDYLYSNSLRLALEKNNLKIMQTLSEATTRMTEGEILQLHKTGDPSITLEEYYKIISAKTGILISAACRIGAILAEQPEDREKALADFGLNAGIAFQLADDILDYVAQQNDLGKKLGKDLEEGKITMPLIHLLKTASEAEKDEILLIIKETAGAAEKKTMTAENRLVNLDRIISLFRKYNAIEESFNSARRLINDAKTGLSVFPDSASRAALLTMAEYTLKRKN